MGFLLIGFLLAFVAWRIVRARTANKRAGLLEQRPTYQLTPRSRWSTSGKDHRL